MREGLIPFYLQSTVQDDLTLMVYVNITPILEVTAQKNDGHSTTLSKISLIAVSKISSLNICPYATLLKMNVNINRIRSSHTIIKAFDGSRRNSVGEIELPIEIGPHTFCVSFHVLKIDSGYNLLLGRPWIHMAGAVPSTLHQQLKYIINNSLVTVNAEPECPQQGDIPFISFNSDIEPNSFHTLEVSNPQFHALGTPLPVPKISAEVMSATQEMMSLGNQPGRGLGKDHQGIKYPIQVASQTGTAGLGYSASSSQRNPHKHQQIPSASTTRRLSSPSNAESAQPPVKVPTNVMVILFPKLVSFKAKKVFVPDPRVEEEK